MVLGADWPTKLGQLPFLCLWERRSEVQGNGPRAAAGPVVLQNSKLTDALDDGLEGARERDDLIWADDNEAAAQGVDAEPLVRVAVPAEPRVVVRVQFVIRCKGRGEGKGKIFRAGRRGQLLVI